MSYIVTPLNAILNLAGPPPIFNIPLRTETPTRETEVNKYSESIVVTMFRVQVSGSGFRV